MRKDIDCADKLKNFQQSKSYRDLLGFITNIGNALATSCAFVDLSRRCNNPVLDQLTHSIFDQCLRLVEETPPIEQAMRFGNIAFRDWHEKMKVQVLPEIIKVIGEKNDIINQELCQYFEESFGNPTRIDYGTGHELNMICFLLALSRADMVALPSDATDIGLVVFPRYLEVVRKLQSTYGLEPAGSRGVWGLDDYQFLPFLWGAAQLRNQTEVSPGDTINEDAIARFKKDYLYMQAMAVILETKKGAPLAETSPMLVDISRVPTWNKLAQGMIKMYEGEVLSKYPVMQHFRFGTLIPFE